jgi:hypothetical protein
MQLIITHSVITSQVLKKTKHLNNKFSSIEVLLEKSLNKVDKVDKNDNKTENKNTEEIKEDNSKKETKENNESNTKNKEKIKKKKISIKDYNTEQFSIIRDEVIGTNTEDKYLNSALSGIFEVKSSSKKSKSLLLYTKDRNLLCKTLDKKLSMTLQKILPNLIEHYKQNPNTLICKIFGLHRIFIDINRKNFHFK